MPLKAIRIALVLILFVSLAGLLFALWGYVPAPINPGLDPGERAQFLSGLLTALTTLAALSAAGLLATEQLDLERRERASDRALSAKREVLMDTIRGLNLAIRQIGEMSDLSIKWADISASFQAGLSQASAGFAVAKLSTVRRLQALHDETGLEFLKLAQKRMPINRLWQIVEDRRQSIKLAKADRKRLLELRSAATANNDHGAITHWRMNLVQIDESIESQKNQLASAMEELGQAHLPFALTCLVKHRKIRDTYRDVVAHIRTEIGVDKDSSESLQAFMDATLPNDRAYVGQMKRIFVGYEAQVDEMARSLGLDPATL
jgi:hypothetical protein